MKRSLCAETLIAVSLALKVMVPSFRLLTSRTSIVALETDWLERLSNSASIDSGLFCAPNRINHSCVPNAGLSGQIGLVALRDIRAGEEVCYDYAMSDASPLTMGFACACGEPGCRGRVEADDWARPELQRRYAGYVSPYLARRIGAAARATDATTRRRGRAGS